MRILAAILVGVAGLVLAAPIPPTPTGGISNSAAPQNAQFNVGTGTVRGLMSVNVLHVTSMTVSTISVTAVAGDGSLVTGLNASNLASGTVPLARIAGRYTGVVGVGELGTGVWKGGVIGTQYGGTGKNWSAEPSGSIPVFTGTGVMETLASGTPGFVLQSTTGVGGFAWTGAPQVLGTHVTDVPLANLLPGTLGTSVLVGDASLTTVSAAKVNGDISGKASGLTSPLPVSDLAAGTLSDLNPASSVTVTGVSPGTYGSASNSVQLVVRSDGRLSSIAQQNIAISMGQIGSGVLPSGITVPAASVMAGLLAEGVTAQTLTPTGVVPGAYGAATYSSKFVVGADGRISSAAQYSIPDVSTGSVRGDTYNEWSHSQTSNSSWTFLAPIEATSVSGNGAGLTSLTANAVSPGSLGSGVIISSVAVGAVTDPSIVSVSGSKVTGQLASATLPAASVESGDLGSGVHLEAASVKAGDLGVGVRLEAASINPGEIGSMVRIYGDSLYSLAGSKILGQITSATLPSASVEAGDLGTGVLIYDASIVSVSGSKVSGVVAASVPADYVLAGDLGSGVHIEAASVKAGDLGTGVLVSDDSIAALTGSKVTGQLTSATLPAANVEAGDLGSGVKISTANIRDGFNGNNQLVQLAADGKLPAIDGSALTNLPGGVPGGVPAGTNGAIQFNSNGAFAGSASSITFSTTTNFMGIGISTPLDFLHIRERCVVGGYGANRGLLFDRTTETGACEANPAIRWSTDGGAEYAFINASAPGTLSLHADSSIDLGGELVTGTWEDRGEVNFTGGPHFHDVAPQSDIGFDFKPWYNGHGITYIDSAGNIVLNADPGDLAAAPYISAKSSVTTTGSMFAGNFVGGGLGLTGIPPSSISSGQLGTGILVPPEYIQAGTIGSAITLSSQLTSGDILMSGVPRTLYMNSLDGLGTTHGRIRYATSGFPYAGPGMSFENVNGTSGNPDIGTYYVINDDAVYTQINGVEVQKIGTDGAHVTGLVAASGAITGASGGIGDLTVGVIGSGVAVGTGGLLVNGQAIVTGTMTVVSSMSANSLSIPGYSIIDSKARIGSMEFQPYALNSANILENMYYNGGWRYRDTGYATNIRFRDGEIQLWSAPSGTAGNTATPVQNVTIQNLGNVGIGTATPGTKLDINGNFQFGSGATKSTGTATGQIVTPKIMLSKEGGYLVKMVNASGVTVTTGTVVNSTASATDYGFKVNPVGGYMPFGTVYGPVAADPVVGSCVDAAECWVCVSGICPAYTTGACARGLWMGASTDIAGMAECSAEPSNDTQHDREIGHNIVGVANSISWMIVHFR